MNDHHERENAIRNLAQDIASLNSAKERYLQGFSDQAIEDFIRGNGLESQREEVILIIDTTIAYAMNIETVSLGHTPTILAKYRTGPEKHRDPNNRVSYEEQRNEEFENILEVMTFLKNAGWIVIWTEGTLCLKPPAINDPSRASEMLSIIRDNLRCFAEHFHFGIGGENIGTDDHTGEEQIGVRSNDTSSPFNGINEGFRDIAGASWVIICARRHLVHLEKQQELINEIVDCDYIRDVLMASFSFKEQMDLHIVFGLDPFDMDALILAIERYISSPHVLSHAYLNYTQNDDTNPKLFCRDYLRENLIDTPIKPNLFGKQSYEMEAVTIAEADKEPAFYAKTQGYRFMGEDELEKTCFSSGPITATMDPGSHAICNPSPAAEMFNYPVNTETFHTRKEYGSRGVTQITVDTTNSTGARLSRSKKENSRDVAMAICLFRSFRYRVTMMIREFTNNNSIILDHVTIGESMTLYIPNEIIENYPSIKDEISKIYFIISKLFTEVTGLTFHAAAVNRHPNDQIFTYHHFVQDDIVTNPVATRELVRAEQMSKASGGELVWITVCHNDLNTEHQLEVGA